MVLPVPDHDTWPVFYADAARAHRATFPARAGDYGPTLQAKLAQAQDTSPDAERRARDALGAWRAAALRQPAVDLLAAPVMGSSEPPPAPVDELEARLPFSAYTRVFSYLGWPAIAVGSLQLAGSDVTRVLGAALALEQAEGGSDGVSGVENDNR